ncbi:hypothetical protein ACTXT7_017635 [Hymenolepis weldensis]
MLISFLFNRTTPHHTIPHPEPPRLAPLRPTHNEQKGGPWDGAESHWKTWGGGSCSIGYAVNLRRLYNDGLKSLHIGIYI